MAKSKKIIKLLVTIACAAVFCFTLGACSGGGAGSGSGSSDEGTAEATAFTGKWVAWKVTQDGKTVVYEEADEDYKAAMDATYFEFRDDGTATIRDGLNVEEGIASWEATGPETATITYSDITLELTVEGDNISVSAPNNTTVIMRRA